MSRVQTGAYVGLVRHVCLLCETQASQWVRTFTVSQAIFREEVMTSGEEEFADG